jgi:exopolyphosphatase/guanosine-5'-triphosphate,3'-diphosphate pyrophosphatase
MMSESTATIRSMRVGVVDVGSNTVRLLVARRNPCFEPLHEARAYLRLGDEIDRNGWISEAKLRETVECVRRYAKEAVAHGAHHVDVVITAPGRLAQNSDELVGALAHGAAARVRVLAAEEEALLAFAGALACVEHLPETVAVCDSGGGSTELVVGRPDSPQWVRSIDVGSLTVRRLLPDDPPGIETVNEARAIVRERLEGVVSPFPMAAYATGGTARALRRVIGRTLEAERLEEMIGWLAKRSASEVSRRHDLDPNRAWSLLGGAIVLAEVQSRLGVPFEVARTGLREGVAAMAFAELAVA